VNLLSRDQTKDQEQAAGLLWSLAASSSEAAALVAEAGAVPPLVQMLGASTEVCIQASGILSSLARCGRESIVADISDRGLLPLVQLLMHESTGVKREAAGALRSLVTNSRERALAAATAGATGSLVCMLLITPIPGEAQEACGRTEAAAVLRELALVSEEQASAAVAIGAIAPLVDMLDIANANARESVSAAEAAAGALQAIAERSERWANAIMDAGAMCLLVCLLGHGTPEGCTSAAAAIRSLTGGEEPAERKAAAFSAGVVEPLLQLLGPFSALPAEGRSDLLGVLRNLCAGPAERKEALLRAGALTPLARLLAIDGGGEEGALVLTVDDHITIIGALRNLATGSDERKSAVIAAGCLEPLVRLHSNGPAEARTAAASTLRNLASGSVQRRAAILAAGAGGALEQRV